MSEIIDKIIKFWKDYEKDLLKQLKRCRKTIKEFENEKLV